MTVAIAMAGALLVLPAAATEREPEVRPVSPAKGGVKTTFTVRWITEIESDNAGEQFYVRGPRGTHCHGLIVYTPAGYAGGTQTVRMGPRVKPRDGVRNFDLRLDDPDPDASPKAELPRWCRGVYRGRVDFENEDGEAEYTVVRFRFKVE